jgi:hypothetical protein
MKKLLFILFAFSIFLLSCGDDSTTTTKSKGDDSTPSLKSSAADLAAFAKKVPNIDAEKMINDLKDRKDKLKVKGIVWANFDPKLMRALYNDSTVLRVVFFIGITDDPSDPKKKDLPILLLQVQRSMGALTPTFEYYESNMACPPPDDIKCGTIENPDHTD